MFLCTHENYTTQVRGILLDLQIMSSLPNIMSYSRNIADNSVDLCEAFGLFTEFKMIDTNYLLVHSRCCFSIMI